MRLFIAIELPDDVRASLARLGDALRPRVPGASWVREQNLHVTLKFLGEVPDARLPAVTGALAKVITEGPMRVTPDRPELFPPRGPVRVVGVGLGGDAGRLDLLYQSIEQQCEMIGYSHERRPFRAHVTLARIRPGRGGAGGRDLRRGPDRLSLETEMAARLPAPAFVAVTFSLMQSHLKPAGPEYVRVAQFPLNPEP